MPPSPPTSDNTGQQDRMHNSAALNDRVVIDYGEDAADYNVWKGMTGMVTEIGAGPGLTHYVHFDKSYGSNGHHQTGAWFPARAVHRAD